MGIVLNHPDGLVIRRAQREDTALVLEFIRRIAAYEKMSDQVVATEETLEKSLFDQEQAWVLVGEYQAKPVGFALFYENFSTFIGRAGLYLEDLYVDPDMRGRGFGKALFQAVAAEAVRRGCARMEWTCLNWNEPSIAFYRQRGAVAMDQWTTYRLAGDAIARAAQQ